MGAAMFVDIFFSLDSGDLTKVAMHKLKQEQTGAL